MAASQRGRKRCKACALNTKCVSRNPALCSSCAASFESTLGALPPKVLPATRALALRCLDLPAAKRGPILAVLHQLGLDPWNISTDYPKVRIEPRGELLSVTSTNACGQTRDIRLVETWADVLAIATERLSAVLWPHNDVTGHTYLHFEHLIGLPQPSLVWESSPLHLDLVEVRPQVAVACLHAGDGVPVAPDLLRYLLFVARHFGVAALRPDNLLVMTRQRPDERGAELSDFITALSHFRLIAPVTGQRFLATFPWWWARERGSDLDFALQCLGPHGDYTPQYDAAYATMRSLAPALLALGYARTPGNGMTFEHRWSDSRVHPWALTVRGRTLRDVVSSADKLIR